jgi:NTE family protein
MTSLKGFLDGLTFTSFMPQGVLHRFLDHHLGQPGELLSDAEILTHRPGVYSGDYLAQWLRPILNDQLGVHTFGDLRISQEEDPGMSLPVSRRYGLVVHTSDVTRRQLVRLPWDYNFYGQDRDQQDVVEAVRASMSIPFFFEPVTFEALVADVDLPRPGGGSIRTHYDGGSVTWVDGGMLRNFPINAFDRVDGKAPRWPTIGVKLSALATAMPTTVAARSAYGVGRGCLATLTSEWDGYDVDASTAGRTIFVDHGQVGTTDFDLTQAQKDMLFLNGVTAATEFVIEMGARGGVPRSGSESRELVRRRQEPA